MSLEMLSIVVLIILIVAGLAFALYKAGFRTTKWKLKLPLFEADVERTPTGRTAGTAAESPKVSTSRTEASQKASNGGVIHKGRITAPAESGAKLGQEAKGQGSRVDDSEIKLS